jgi:BED zinc finger
MSSQDPTPSELHSDQFDGYEFDSNITVTSSQASGSTSSRKRPRTSFVWDHMPAHRTTAYFNAENALIWRCKHCTKVYRESGGTTVIKNHLKQQHAIVDTMEEQRAIQRQQNITQAFLRGEESDHKRRRQALEPSSMLRTPFNPATFENLYVRWITRCTIPFRMAELEEFRTLLVYLNPEIDCWLPSNHETIHKWTMRTYDQEKLHTQQALQSALSRIHFTVDLWSSPNSLALIGIIAHFIAENGVLRQSVLALRELIGTHSGENQASVVMNVVDDYGIASKVGYFMMDNAKSNDTMVNALSLCITLFLINLYKI